jgi:hypothetical protein
MASDVDELARLSRELEQAERYEIHLRNRIVAIRDELAAGQVSRALIGAWLEQRARELNPHCWPSSSSPTTKSSGDMCRSPAATRGRRLGGNSSILARDQRTARGDWIGPGLTARVQAARV